MSVSELKAFLMNMVNKLDSRNVDMLNSFAIFYLEMQYQTQSRQHFIDSAIREQH